MLVVISSLHSSSSYPTPYLQTRWSSFLSRFPPSKPTQKRPIPKSASVTCPSVQTTPTWLQETVTPLYPRTLARPVHRQAVVHIGQKSCRPFRRLCVNFLKTLTLSLQCEESTVPLRNRSLPLNAFLLGRVYVLVWARPCFYWTRTHFGGSVRDHKTSHRNSWKISPISKMCRKQNSQQRIRRMTNWLLGIYIFFNLTFASPPILPFVALPPPIYHPFVFMQTICPTHCGSGTWPSFV